MGGLVGTQMVAMPAGCGNIHHVLAGHFRDSLGRVQGAQAAGILTGQSNLKWSHRSNVHRAGLEASSAGRGS
jgi:hypothetical protein